MYIGICIKVNICLQTINTDRNPIVLWHRILMTFVTTCDLDIDNPAVIQGPKNPIVLVWETLDITTLIGIRSLEPYDVKRCFVILTRSLTSESSTTSGLYVWVCVNAYVWSVNKSYPYLTLGPYKRFIYINGLYLKTDGRTLIDVYIHIRTFFFVYF